MKQTMTYKQTNKCTINLDVYNHQPNSPVIIYIHGGALIFGTRDWLSLEQVEYYLNAGFSVVSIDYRLAPETNLEAIVEDIQDAINWVRTSATKLYDFDTNRIALIGCSAGAYLSLLIGTIDKNLKAIVSFYGYGDILGQWYAEPSEFYCQRPIVSPNEAYNSVGRTETTDGPWSRFNFYLFCRQQGVWVEEVTGLNRHDDRLRMYNPIYNLSEDYPPTLFLHGDKDTDVPYEQSIMLYDKLKNLDVNTELVTIHNGDHGFDHNFNEPNVQFAFKKVVAFLQRHMSK